MKKDLLFTLHSFDPFVFYIRHTCCLVKNNFKKLKNKNSILFQKSHLFTSPVILCSNFTCFTSPGRGSFPASRLNSSSCYISPPLAALSNNRSHQKWDNETLWSREAFYPLGQPISPSSAINIIWLPRLLSKLPPMGQWQFLKLRKM